MNQSLEVVVSEKLDEGHFATIFVGKMNGQEVVIKKPKRQLYGYDKNLHNEATLVAKIKHDNIVKVHGISKKPQAIVMERLHAHLRRVLRKQAGDITISQRWTWLSNIAAGLGYLHSLAPVIIHRDIKPHNILITSDLSMAKIIDFGLSTTMDGQFIRDKISARGSPLWMAPEVLMEGELNEKVDVYAFGLVVWETLTTQKPFNEYTHLEAFRKAVVDKHVRPPIPTDWPDGLTSLVESLWAPLAEDRPSVTQIEHNLVLLGPIK